MMQDAVSDQISHIEQHLAMCKQKLRGLRGSRINQKHEEGNGDNFMLFPHCQYPFLQDDRRECKMVKTVINCDISNTKLQKLMRINHPNIINIQKIARGHRTLSLNASSDVFYSFYYEIVPYSLKKIITAGNINHNLIFQLATLNMAKILRNVSGFLMKEGIYNLFKLQDIGITKEAQLKIYISPLIVMGGLSLKMGNYKAVTASIDKLLGWWETSLATHEVIHPSNNRILMQIPEDMASEESVENNFRETIQRGKTFGKAKVSSKNMNPKMRFSSKQAVYNNIRASTYSNRGQQFVASSVEIGKNMNINEEIKFIRQRLRETRIRNSQSDQTVSQLKKDAINRIQSMPQSYQKANHMTFKVNDAYVNPESVQHTNSIHITKNPAQNRQVKKLAIKIPKKKAIQSQCPSPTHAEKPNQSLGGLFQRASLDTYQMELNPPDAQFCEQPQENNWNDPALGERELSVHNLKIKYGNENKFEAQKSNQVTKRNVHQSAGPLQFQQLFHQFLKPQYKPKKSDIEEESGEQESQQSKPLSPNIKDNRFNPFETDPSKAAKAGSLQDLLAVQSLRWTNIPAGRQLQNKDNEKGLEGKLYPLHKSRQVKPGHTSKVRVEAMKASKVKKVLEKTKEAIALLNKKKTAINFSFKLAPC